jgi:hypothetical protein
MLRKSKHATMSHPEFEVSRRHVFLNSNNRARSPFNIEDDGKLRLDLDSLGETAVAEDGQFIRVSLQEFSSSNVFDRHLSPANQFSMYVGSQIAPSATFPNRQNLTEGTLATCLLLSARYENYASVYLDIANAIVTQLQLLYLPADYTYSVTRLGGGGPTFAREGASQVTGLGVNNAPLNFNPNFPISIDELGQYRQSGEKILTCTIRIQKNSGSFPVIFDNSSDDLAFGFVFSNGNNCYLTCGATSTPITSTMSYLQAASRMSSGLGISPDSDTAVALGSFNGKYTFSTTTSANDTLEITFASRCPIQLDPSPLVYVRLGQSGNNFATANCESDSVQDPSQVQSSSILAAIPAQKDNIFYLSEGESPFQVDFNVRSLHQLSIFLTNEYGDTQWRSNAYNLSYYVTNISFKAQLRISIMQKAVVAVPESKFVDHDVPARFVGQPQSALRNGADDYVENITTRVARRGV